MSNDARLQAAAGCAADRMRSGVAGWLAITNTADEFGVCPHELGKVVEARKRRTSGARRVTGWRKWSTPGDPRTRHQFTARRMAAGVSVAEVAIQANARRDEWQRARKGREGRMRSLLLVGWVHQFEDGELTPGCRPPDGYRGPPWTPGALAGLWRALDACVAGVADE